jgi:hypothetical protein
LQELADSAPGTIFKTFHFVLNNAVLQDNRIPPYLMSYDEASTRNALPVPNEQYGDPGTGGVYNHYDVVPFAIPVGAVRAEARLFYQQTSWEYIQFLWKQPTSVPLPTSTFLANEGVNMMDAWLNARLDDDDPNSTMAPPLEMVLASATVTGSVPGPGQASNPLLPADQMTVLGYNDVTGAIDIAFTPACDGTDQNIYWGDLAEVSLYDYTGVECSVGMGGTASFNPGVGSYYFLIVGNNGNVEGSYGFKQPDVPPLGDQRPEDIDTTGCPYPRELTAICE